MKQNSDEGWEERVKREVSRNFDEFRKLLPSILETKRGKIALMRDGKIIEYFNTRLQARASGEERYSDGIWSMQEVTDEVIEVGLESRAEFGKV